MRRTQLTRDNVTMLWTYQIWGGCFAIIRSSNFTMVKLCKSSSSRTGLNIYHYYFFTAGTSTV